MTLKDSYLDRRATHCYLRGFSDISNILSSLDHLALSSFIFIFLHILRINTNPFIYLVVTTSLGTVFLSVIDARQ